MAPVGVVLSGTCDRPPPSESWPQRSFFSGIVPARSRNVLPHVPVPAVDRKSSSATVVGGGVDVVVTVLVEDVDVVAGADVDDVLVVDDSVVVDDVLPGLVLVLDEVVVGDVVLVDDVVAGSDVLDDVVVAPALQAAGSGSTMPGTDAVPAQSTSKSVTQSTQSTRSVVSKRAPPQLDGG